MSQDLIRAAKRFHCMISGQMNRTKIILSWLFSLKGSFNEHMNLGIFVAHYSLFTLQVRLSHLVKWIKSARTAIKNHKLCKKSLRFLVEHPVKFVYWIGWKDRTIFQSHTIVTLCQMRFGSKKASLANQSSRFGSLDLAHRALEQI